MKLLFLPIRSGLVRRAAVGLCVCLLLLFITADSSTAEEFGAVHWWQSFCCTPKKEDELHLRRDL